MIVWRARVGAVVRPRAQGRRPAHTHLGLPDLDLGGERPLSLLVPHQRHGRERHGRAGHRRGEGLLAESLHGPVAEELGLLRLPLRNEISEPEPDLSTRRVRHQLAA